MSILKVESNSPQQTTSFAKTLGSNLRGGEVIELISDLGGGKTTFTKGLAEGAGSKDNVHSPSFTIENEYKTDKFVIHHLDFYRLNDPGIMSSELEEILSDHSNVVVIEWADIVEDLLPDTRLIINIKATNEKARTLEINYPSELEYLLSGLE